MNNHRSVLLPLALMILFAHGAGAAEQIGLDTLLDEMLDRTTVARFPDPAYTCRQASSYDRGSRGADQEGWYANNDRSFFVRSEMHGDRAEWVLMDVEGPGAIVRWWVTAPAYLGVIRVYLDGAETPEIEDRVDELVGGGALVGPPLSEERARGRNLYLPIPYAKRCKVTFDRPNFQTTKQRDDLLYYQINYRTYQPGTSVRSFSQAELAALGARIAAVQQALLRPSPAAPAAASTDSVTRSLEPGAALQQSLAGPAAVCRVTVQLQAQQLEQALRSTVMRASFDGQQTIWCPVGDFFGSGVGVNPYTGWYRQVEADGQMTCWWVMPYEKTCTIALENLGDQPVAATLGPIEACRWQWDQGSLYFHSCWRQQRGMETKRGGAPALDWNYVTVQGQGVYVGDTLAVYNRVAGWWGEGDEKVYVDGETFPSHFGTGTEDYYGYAWCTPQRFEAPFHAQPRAEGPRNAGNVTNTRVRLLDAIPFRRDLRFDMEVWHSGRTSVDYAATTYWYGKAGAAVNVQPDPEELVVPVASEFPIAGFRVLTRTAGLVTPQSLAQFGKGVWSEDDHLWWTEAKPGDKLEIAVPVREAGNYAVSVIMTKARDYGVIQLSLDDQPLGEPLDLYNPTVIRTDPILLGARQLTAGDHRLTMEIVGANEKALKRYMAGLDEVLLRRADQ